MYYTYRRRRRLNKARFFTFLLVLALVVVGVLTLIMGRFPWEKENLQGQATPSVTPAGGATATVTPTTTPAPTPWPTPEPISEESTDPEVLNTSWKTPAVFTGANAFDDAASQMKSKDGATISYWVLENNQPLSDYTPRDEVVFGTSESYTDVEGVTAFRGNHYRDSASFGTADISAKELEIVWSHDTGAISGEGSYWPGTGWTGQPLLVHWDEDIKAMMNINADMKAKDLVEVIYPTLDGNIYFLDLETGKPTRDPIEVGFTMKGTGMVDPRGYPLLYTGMGINENGNKLTEFKYMMFSLIDQKMIYKIIGRDPMAFRSWGAFDSSAILDGRTDTLFEAAENGLVYRVKLNTKFDREAGSIDISPQITKFRYKDSVNPELGIENSPAFYKNYMYFCDNGGTFMCLDINTMKPVWVNHVGDDTDSSTVIEETDEGVFLYTANQVDKRSQETQATENCNIRKFDALTGELIWQKDYACIYNYYLNGGVLGTPLIGKNDIEDLIIYPVCFTGSNSDGKLVALNKKNGEEVWVRKLNAYSWCSPVDFLGSDGKTYAVFTDYAGNLHLFDPKTGKDLDVVSLGKNIESSPAIYGNMIVVGSYAQKIYGIKIK
jgi:outer membrane protein assembly factor BamB